MHIAPDGAVVTDDDWEASAPRWLPTDDDNTYVVSLMAPVHEPGRMASWIAPPASGIHQKPVDYDYVRA